MFMRRSWLFSVFTIALLAAPFASAHDAKLHKGKGTEGEIVSLAAGKMELKTAAGPLTVTLPAKTKYEHGDKTVTKSHLQKGEQVTVFGTKLATGELVASEVLIGAPADSHHDAADSHHK
jgi:hypothetical protein